MAKSKKSDPTPTPTPDPASKSKAGSRLSWFHPDTEALLIDGYARKMESFLEAIRDGVIEEREIRDQESRIVALMKEIEPRLDDDLHDKVTRLLCEVTAYDLMHMLYLIQKDRPKTIFRG